MREPKTRRWPGESSPRKPLSRSGHRSRSERRVLAEEDADQDAMRPPIERAPVKVPLLDLWGRDKGKLMDALAVCGVVFLDLNGAKQGEQQILAEPNYEEWLKVFDEARSSKADFFSRQCVTGKHLRWSRNEDLNRTMQGDTKAHSPDRRENLSMPDLSAKTGNIDWADLAWIPEKYVVLKQDLVELLEAELRPACLENENRDPKDLASKLVAGREAWSRSGLRHCFYPASGTASEHTDYGIVTL